MALKNQLNSTASQPIFQKNYKENRNLRGRRMKKNDKNPLFKLYYSDLMFEVTRKCNMNCPHCMRGEPQNVSITKKVVDATLDEIGALNRLFLTGGEPFLEPEMIDYIVDGVIKRKIPVFQFGVTTNGIIKNPQIANSINKITQYIADNCADNMDKKQLRMIGKITVSCDDYHDPVDIVDTMKFYRKYLNNHSVIVREKPYKEDEIEYILFMGRAKNLILKPNKRFRYKVAPFRLSFLRNAKGEDVGIETTIQIGADGKILAGEDCSYEQQDKRNYGNVLEKHISTVFKDGLAFKEPFTEHEANMYNAIYSKYVNREFTEDFTKEIIEEYIYLYECIYAARERLQETYPLLTYEEIVDLAYHDLNIYIKEHYGKGTEFPKIGSFDLFDSSLEESIAEINKVKKKYLFETIMGNVKYANKKVEPIPNKLTRERIEIERSR